MSMWLDISAWEHNDGLIWGSSKSNPLNSSITSEKSEDEDSNSEDQGDYTSEDSKLEEEEDKDLGNSPVD